MANAAWTYNTIIQALQDWPVQTNPVYVTNLPRLLALGELRLVRDLNLEIFEVVDSTVAITIGTREVPKPAALMVVRSFHLNVGVSSAVPYKYLKQRSYDFCVAAYPSQALADRAEPEMFAELSETNWYVVPSADAAYTATVRYVARPTGLTSSNQTSWLGTYCPDALFAAVLMESEHYLKADDRYGDQKTKYYEELLPNTTAELIRLKRSGELAPYKRAAQPAKGAE